MSEIHTDYLIVGSGPAGVSAAWPLVRSGAVVMMVDGADDSTPVAQDGVAPWRRMLGENLAGVAAPGNASPKLATPLARGVLDQHPQRGIVTGDFAATGAVARGGLSTIWGGLVAEYDKHDLRGWPVTAAELRPFYKEVVTRIGVSGSRDDGLAGFYGLSAPLDPALPLGASAAKLLARHRGGGTGALGLGLARNALIARDRNGRLACDQRLACLWGCPRGAIYDSRQDLADLRAQKNFSLVDRARIVALSRNANAWEALAQDGRSFRAPRVLLAAGCLATTRLALTALDRPPASLPLRNNPVMAFGLLLPARLGKPPAAKGHALAQLGYRYSLGDSYVTGALYEASALPDWSFTARLPLSRRAGLQLFPKLAPAMLVATCYFPAVFSDNHLIWRGAGEALRLHVQGGVSAALSGTAQQVARELARAFRGLGAWMLPGRSFAPHGADVHYGGTLPMGSATTAQGEVQGAPGLFVVDGAALPSVAPKYPTLTIMANAARIGQLLAG